VVAVVRFFFFFFIYFSVGGGMDGVVIGVAMAAGARAVPACWLLLNGVG